MRRTLEKTIGYTLAAIAVLALLEGLSIPTHAKALPKPQAVTPCSQPHAAAPKAKQKIVKVDPVQVAVMTSVQKTMAKKPLQVDKLCRAIAVAETGYCADGTARKRNNCHGIMEWTNGQRHPKYFKRKEDSFTECERIWSASYKRLPDLKLAMIWTGNDNPEQWLSTVLYKYSVAK